MLSVIKQLNVPKVLLRHIMIQYLDVADIKNIMLNIKEMNVLDSYSKKFLCNVSKGLLYNCQIGKLVVVQHLISHNIDASIDASIDINHGVTIAAEYGHLSIVQYLVSAGATYNEYAILENCVKRGHIAIVQYLKLDAYCIANYNCLIKIATRFGHFAIVQYLVELKCNSLDLNKSAINKLKNKVSIIDNINIDDINIDGNYLIKTACEHGYLDIAQYLVSAGADVRVYNNYAIKAATKYGHNKMIQYLVSVGADIHVENDILLRIACENGHYKIVRYLVLAGCNSQVIDAIKIASEYNYTNIIKYLVSHCANI